MKLLSLLKVGPYKHPSDQRAKELWQRVSAYQIDEEGAAAPFSHRLAKEQNWSRELTLCAIEEYKRFMFLAVAAGHPVTPSKTVDEVWHLHLIYSRSYWEEFCVKVLDRIIHHDPGNGNEGEQSLYNNQYHQTLDSYVRLFGEQPPMAIWGAQNGNNNVRSRIPETIAVLPLNGHCNGRVAE